MTEHPPKMLELVLGFDLYHPQSFWVELDYQLKTYAISNNHPPQSSVGWILPGPPSVPVDRLVLNTVTDTH